MTPKIIFFDIDDTLSRNGELAEHNKTTLEQLAKTDIKVIIATGRPKPFLPDDILALGDAGVFDAIICTNGQYNFYQDSANKPHIISHYPLSHQHIEHIERLCHQNELLYKFDSDKHMAWVKIDDHFRELIKDRPNVLIDADFAKHNTVYQCSVFFNHDTHDLRAEEFAKQGLKLLFWHHMGGDILPIEASKARAVKDVCQHFSIDVSDAMAFGDGFNDIEMFDLVGHAVAMGDGEPALIEHADQVTGTIEEKGIQTVLAQFGLL